ncbi:MULTISPECIES: RagB/SusD family nutrient uptake outer membrane protein [unclassified Prevotella]|uniref:RagB/SusD family nutrient uptake outer membrane protein n=1 Tax=unclassified Prevotella TaxID=2638335 RepID=UPI0005132340|nr:MULTISPECIES: RagB/SusD family nutrient uptake outer membrane protein [unclassified Prevotella]KGI61221.1 starch-binding protein [Prevotella sp. S7 MS 2]
MKKRYIPTLMAGLLFATAFTSCDFLDTSESTYYDKDEILYDPSRVYQLCTQVYTYLPNGLTGLSGALQDAATDDAIHVYPTANVQRFVNGSWSANRTVDDVFSDYYQAIHDANFYLENCLGLTYDDWKNSDGFQDTYNSYLNYEHEVRLLRAFYYFELAKRYGNVPLVTKTLSAEEASAVKPTNAESILKFVIDECTAVAEKLPAKVTTLPGAAANMQRVSKGTALALKSRATLYLASPLFNPNKDVKRWEDAAKAAYDVIDKSSEFGYKLDSKYNNLFGPTNNQSSEVIMCVPGGETTSFESNNFPIGVNKGNGNTCPTENLVDAYEMANGDVFDWNNPAHAANPYKSRDPRMKMTIVCNGDKWPAKEAVETFIGGKNGQPLLNATTTGYYLRKYVNNKVTFEAGQTTKNFHHNWVVMRYAEILLNYAEAAAEAYGPDATPAGFTLSACEAVNMVRQRPEVKMPKFPKGMTKEAFIKRLRNERRVEFAFEGQRFWDLRRWKALDEMKNIYKVEIKKGSDGKLSYERLPLTTYDIQDKLYFYPFANAELYKNRNLKQNPGWE